MSCVIVAFPGHTLLLFYEKCILFVHISTFTIIMFAFMFDVKTVLICTSVFAISCFAYILVVKTVLIYTYQFYIIIIFASI